MSLSSELFRLLCLQKLIFVYRIITWSKGALQARAVAQIKEMAADLFEEFVCLVLSEQDYTPAGDTICRP